MNKNPSLNIWQYLGVLLYITVWLFIAWKFLLPKYSNTIFSPTISGEISNSWIIQTWSWEPTTILDNEKEHRLEVLIWWLNLDSLDIWKYPEIKVNDAISWWTILFEVEPTDKVKNYGYFSSDSYYFAFRFFIGDFQNWWYYNVFRKENNGVWNDTSSWLNWAVSGKDLSNGYVWAIPLHTNVVIAKDKDSYWYGYVNTLKMINGNIWKKIRVGGFLSSIKEVNGWWEITKIKRITIIYEGKKWAITLE